MKKYYPLLALFAAAWLFSSCGSNDNPAAGDTTSPSASTPSLSAAPAPPSPSPSSSATVDPLPTESVASSSSTPTGKISAALEVAKSLKVRGRSPSTDYSRESFGSAWKDVDHNGCDTRNDILQRDFTTSILKSGTGNCKVIGGTWTDPYSNESYTFTQAPSGAQIDHVVALKNAWQMGADLWTDQMRVEFANDPLNLQVTIASLNRQKSDSNAASWLPPYKPGRCSFIARQVAVKAKWKLYVTESEKEVILSILSKPDCETVVLPK